MSCLTEDQLIALADGGIAPNQRPSIDQHLSRCANCRAELRAIEELLHDMGEAVLPKSLDAHVAGVLSRLDDKEKPEAPLRPYPWVAAGVLAVAAAAALFVNAEKNSYVASRGEHEVPSLSRDVGVRLYVGKDRLTSLVPGMHVAKDTPFTASFTHLGTSEAHLLLFALDSKREIHWLYPSYEVDGTDPVSIPLPPSARDVLLPTSVVLEAPAGGPLRFVALVTRAPMPVSSIERLSHSERTIEHLQTRFPEASFETFGAIIDESP